MPTLGELRSRVLAERANPGPGLVGALVQLAESEPVFRHRAAPVRALLEEVARLLDANGDPQWKGRVLLRLAEVKLADEDNEGADELAERAAELLGESATAEDLLRAGCVKARSLVRRGKLAPARSLLGDLGAELPEASETLAGRRAAVALALALGETSLETDGEEADAEQISASSLPGIEAEPLFADAAFTATRRSPSSPPPAAIRR